MCTNWVGPRRLSPRLHLTKKAGETTKTKKNCFVRLRTKTPRAKNKKKSRLAFSGTCSCSVRLLCAVRWAPASATSQRHAHQARASSLWDDFIWHPGQHFLPGSYCCCFSRLPAFSPLVIMPWKKSPFSPDSHASSGSIWARLNYTFRYFCHLCFFFFFSTEPNFYNHLRVCCISSPCGLHKHLAIFTRLSSYWHISSSAILQ